MKTFINGSKAEEFLPNNVSINIGDTTYGMRVTLPIPKKNHILYDGEINSPQKYNVFTKNNLSYISRDEIVQGSPSATSIYANYRRILNQLMIEARRLKIIGIKSEVSQLVLQYEEYKNQS